MKDLRTWFELKRWGFLHAGFVRAVDGISFQLKLGEAITIVGESGSGKTTLLRTILGLAKSTEGDITFDGKRIDRRKAEDLAWLRSHVGFVQQDPYGALAPFMTVSRILNEPLTINKIAGDDDINRVKLAIVKPINITVRVCRYYTFVGNTYIGHWDADI